MRWACKLRVKVISLDDLYIKDVMQMVMEIMTDEHHPLHDNYVFMRSGKILTLPKQHMDRFRKSFVPKSMKLFNHFLGI